MDQDERQPVDHGVTSGKSDVDSEPNAPELSDLEKPSDGSTKVEEAAKPEYEYITGVKLFLTIASITLVCFLMLLDMSIIVTVSFGNSLHVLESLLNKTGHPTNHQ